MISPQLLLSHFYKVAPFVTNDFAITEPIVSALVDSSLNIVCTLNAGSIPLKVGKYYNLQGTVMENPILSCVLNGTDWILTTKNPHNLTVPVYVSDDKYCFVDSAWSAQQEIIDVPSSTTVVVRNKETIAQTGVLLEPLVTESSWCQCTAINGNVATLLAGEGYLYPCNLRANYIVVSQRIFVVPTAERAAQVFVDNMQMATSKTLFLIMGDRLTIPSPNNNAQVTSAGESVNIAKLQIKTNFDFLVFYPKDNSQESCRSQIEDAYSSMYNNLNKIFFGLKNGVRDSQLSPTKSGTVGLEGSKVSDPINYVHQFSYDVLDYISSEKDGLNHKLIDFNEAIRNIDGTLSFDLLCCDESAQMNLNIRE